MTGGAGFIGSTYARLFADEHEIVVLDKLTYAGRPRERPGRRRSWWSAASRTETS